MCIACMFMCANAETDIGFPLDCSTLSFFETRSLSDSSLQGKLNQLAASP